MDNNENAQIVVVEDQESHVDSLMKPKKKGFLTGRLDSILGLKSFDIETSVPSANTSFLKSKYGQANPSRERLDNFMKDFCTDIQGKNNKGEYACVKVLPEDLAIFRDTIIGVFKNRGYVVADLKENIENIVRDYIFVCWDKFDSSQGETE